MYRFVVERRNLEAQAADFVMYADELFCYGLHKLGGDDLAANYQHVYDTLSDAIDAEKAMLASKGLTYSHNAYFKSAKSRYDLDRLLGFVEKQL